ncbi:MAG TPA: HepT-like ribonuclease domain-containing protein [Vicinamibacterales bacterium]
MSRDDAYFLDMLRFAREVVEFSTGVSREQYLADLGKRRSIERSLELVGEAARRVSTSFKDVHPEIPWRDIIGQRSVLAHDYGEVSDERV